MTDPEHQMLTVAEIAAHCRVSKMTIYREIHSGAIPAKRIGRSFRVRARDAKAYLDGADVAHEDGVA